MPRHSYKKHAAESDPVFESLELSKLINYIMRDGKKTVAAHIVYGVCEDIKQQGEEPLKILHKAISNVGPNVEVKPRRLGGASYLVPTEVKKERRVYLALHWIIEAAAAKSNKEFRSFRKKLLTEIVDAAKGQGQAINKRLQAEKLAEQNKAFAHLKW